MEIDIFKQMRNRIFQVFILPITFKTVSFHHRAHYAIKVYLQAPHCPIASAIICQSGIQPEMKADRKSGNIFGVGGRVSPEGVFWSERFPIEYNDQCAKFAAGVWLRVSVQDQPVLPIVIELYRVDVSTIKEGKVIPVDEPEEKKVSEEVIYMALGEVRESAMHPFSYRKLIFPTCEYISFMDVGCEVSFTGWQPSLNDLKQRRESYINGNYLFDCCIVNKRKPDAERFLLEIYKLAVQSKLKAYEVEARRLREKVRQYWWLKKHRRHALTTDEIFQVEFVRRGVPDLNYVGVVREEEGQEGGMQSNLPVMKGKGLSEALCDHYECRFHQLGESIVHESWMLQRNIRALFQRSIQLIFAMGEMLAPEIGVNEMKRAKLFLKESEVSAEMHGDVRGEIRGSVRGGITQEMFVLHKQRIKQLLGRLDNYSILEIKQPLLVVSKEEQAGTPLDIARTLTVLVHGFRGNQFDLSKLKSYLSLFLGFHHFYAIKSIAGDLGKNASLGKLGQMAGDQLGQYLQLHPGIKSINVIGFSMGGVVARAMMKYLKPYLPKFNLLLTLASPHLGMKELQSCLVRAGLFYMRRVAKVESMQDLNNERVGEDGGSRFLLELAHCEFIGSYKWVVLVGSREDEYVPPYSSLCEYTGDNEQIKELSEGFNAQRKDAIRCCARIEVEQSLWDRVTLRRTHISLLEQDSFIRMLVARFQHYFTHTR